MRFLTTWVNSKNWQLRAVSAGVLLSGLLAIGGVLFGQIRQRSGIPIVSADANATLVAGFSLLYLASLLGRGKRMAWTLSIIIYIYLVARNIEHFVRDYPAASGAWPVILNLLIPGFSLLGLVLYWKKFNVRSEVRSIASGLRTAALVLMVAIIFGVAGFQLMDKHDFHQEISLPASLHYTVDQFNLTTSHPLEPHTRRARLFLDSLGAAGLIATIYAAVSIFSPIRFRLSGETVKRNQLNSILERYGGDSEDFFKLWPLDKEYFIESTGQAGIAYRVNGGIALAVGDPSGNPRAFDRLLDEFANFCKPNDWQIAFIHTHPKFSKLYARHGFELQKIGEEAIVDLVKFNNTLRQNKYFRQINNRFEKLGYSYEVLTPPHAQVMLSRLREISQEWLKAPGRAERGMMMGYFNDDYLQQCKLLIARDEAKTIQGFINLVPSFDSQQTNFDMLRSSRASAGNINDYLIMKLIEHTSAEGFAELNMGLAPLAGLDKAERNTISRLLLFVYNRGNSFYSFKGLAKFKEKYEPQWQSRYIVYSGGAVGFTRTMNALVKAMRVEV